MKTTLRAIKNCAPGLAGWRALLKYLGKTEADDAPISLLTILESNGFDHALWCLRAVEGFDREKGLFAAFCAKQVKHSMNDKRSLEALEVAKRYTNGLATEKELKEVIDSANDSASDAWAVARAASDAANDAWAVVHVAHAAWAVVHAAHAASAAIRTRQEKEFVRMLNCIENGEVYTI